MLIDVEITNRGRTDAENIRFTFGVDPDQDYSAYSTFNTYIDSQDLDGDGVNDWVQAVGIYSGWTIGFGICDPDAQEIGGANWSTSADVVLNDYAGSS